MLKRILQRINNPLLFFKKVPKYVLIIDNYNTFTYDLLLKMKCILQIEKLKVLVDKEKNEFDLENSKYNINYFYDNTLLPDMIILCNDIFSFKIENPLLLSRAEIWFSRYKLKENTFYQAYWHYSDCEIRNGV
ncbi:DUF5099 domain-containing protein [Hamiltosporidium tvaerminnensis]|uniref:DUF5099 domain-containing protein n=1 Tax=Hamiltosporidium tvaerminnensis TaxID=1176355 RepID=A0A4Q9L0Z0_9MICR|nr:DUF5099 domain-containing protein [Hamiltosporidium tvaerminnensis]